MGAVLRALRRALVPPHEWAPDLSDAAAILLDVVDHLIGGAYAGYACWPAPDDLDRRPRLPGAQLGRQVFRAAILPCVGPVSAVLFGSENQDAHGFLRRLQPVQHSSSGIEAPHLGLGRPP